MNFDLANLNYQWLELRRSLKELSRQARLLTREKTDVCLYYSIGETRQVSPVSGIRIPTFEKQIRTDQLRRQNPSKSLLKEKGRTWVTKLSIPYRVFIKSKVKQRYKPSIRSSLDTSFATTSSDLDTFTESSFDSVFNSPRSYCSEPPPSDFQLDLADHVEDDRIELFNGDNTDGSEQSDKDYVNSDHLADLVKVTSPNYNNINLSKAIKKNNDDNNQDRKVCENHNSSSMASNRSCENSPPKSPTLRQGTRLSPVSIEEQSPIVTKRRRLNSGDSVGSNSSQHSPRESPVPMMDSPLPAKQAGLLDKPLSLKVSPPSGGDKLKLYPTPEGLRGCGTPGTPLSKHFSLSPGLSPMTVSGEVLNFIYII